MIRRKRTVLLMIVVVLAFAATAFALYFYQDKVFRDDPGVSNQDVSTVSEFGTAPDQSGVTSAPPVPRLPDNFYGKTACDLLSDDVITEFSQAGGTKNDLPMTVEYMGSKTTCEYIQNEVTLRVIVWRYVDEKTAQENVEEVKSQFSDAIVQNEFIVQAEYIANDQLDAAKTTELRDRVATKL